MKKSTLIAGLLLAAGFSGAASAHDYNLGLTTPAAATDKFYIVCGSGTTKIGYQVRRNAGGPANLAACKLTSCTTGATGTTTTSAGTGAFSPLKTLAAGAAAFQFQVKKSPAAAGAVGYTLRAHCLTSTGGHASQSTGVTYLPGGNG